MYNSLASAKQKGLVSVAKNGAVKLGVSTQQYQDLRDSVRLVSKQTYVVVITRLEVQSGRELMLLFVLSFSGGGLFVFDVNNIPSAQGAWPALWMTGSNWPQQGEIDIIEGQLNDLTLFLRERVTDLASRV